MTVNSKDTTSIRLALALSALLLFSGLVALAPSVRANPGADVTPNALYSIPEQATRPGDAVTFVYEWSNVGDTDATVNVALTIDNGSGPSVKDTQDGVEMAADSSGSGTLNWTAEDTGFYNVSVILDYDEQVSEDDETNNELLFEDFEVELSSGNADLEIEFQNRSPTEIHVHEEVTVTAAYRNSGNLTPQVPISVGLFAYQGDTRPADPVDEIAIPVLWKGLDWPAWEAFWIPEDGGEYTIELVIDYNDNLSADAGATDGNTSNNVYRQENVTVTGGGGDRPDIIFDTLDPNAFAAEPEPGVTGTSVLFSYAILNQGAVDSELGGVVAMFVKHEDDSDWPADPVNQTNPIFRILGNSSQRIEGPLVDLGWEAPTDGEGNWDIKLVLDYNDEIDEGDETNNEMLWSVIHKDRTNKFFEVVKKLPDLKIESIELNGTAYADEQIEVSLLITNLGQDIAKNVTLDIRLYSDNTGGETVEVRAGLVGDVGLEFPTPYTWLWTPTEVGEYTIKGFVDPDDEIEELSTNPNDNKRNLLVNVERKLSDLYVQNIAIEPLTDDGDIQIGVITNLNVTLANQGLRALTQEEGELVQITLTVGDVVLTQTLDRPLGKDESTLVTFQLTNESLGLLEEETKRTVLVEVDPGDEVPEMNENNNELDRIVFFRSVIDLVLVDLTIPEVQSQTDHEMEISFQVRLDNLPLRDADRTVTWTLIIIDNLTIFSVEEQTGDVTLNVTNPQTTVTYGWTPDNVGNYTLTVAVSYGLDTDENNNELALNFSVMEFSLDLEIAAVDGIKVDSEDPGQRTVTVNVGYSGSAPKVSDVKVWVKVFTSENWKGSWSKDTVTKDLGNLTVEGAITQGDFRTKTIIWPNAVKGCYVLVANVDPANAIQEDDEANNIFPSPTISIDGGCGTDGDDDDGEGNGILPGPGLLTTLMAATLAVALVALRRRR